MSTDEDPLAARFEALRERLLGTAWFVVGNRDDAREAVQEAEAWLTIVGTCANRQDEQAQAYMALYRDTVKLFARGGGVENSSVPLARLSLGWVGAIAGAYEAAGELVGAESAANWQQPPAAE